MKRPFVLAVLTVSVSATSALVACSHTPAEPDGSAPVDGGHPSVAVDAALPPCVSNPTTYLEIINACTDAQAIDKTVDLSPMSAPDGGLQPLP
jgi:hypothetical protein